MVFGKPEANYAKEATMGGGGSYYDRDTTDGYATTSAGVSRQAEEKLSRTFMNSGLDPKGRKLVSEAENPVVYAFDETGSMGNLPKIIYDKMPLIAGQIVENGYIKDPEVSLAAVGDIECDQAPIQIGDFSEVRKLDSWLERIWLEGNGGGNGGESYEFTAYFYARYCEMPKAVAPFFLMTGDEPMRETLDREDLARHFGGTHETVGAAQVFKELLEKFQGNVFLIYASHGGNERSGVVEQWRGMVGPERVIVLDSDKAVADVTLGIFAVMTGSRTLDEYCEDMRTKRDKAQSDDRVAEVRTALQQLTAIAPQGRKTRKRVRAEAEAADDAAAPATGSRKKTKRGRI